MLIVVAGCASAPAPVQIVEVVKPISTCAAPPQLPSFDSRVDQLTLDHINNPGIVVSAYKYDMLVLRESRSICEAAFREYGIMSKDIAASSNSKSLPNNHK